MSCPAVEGVLKGYDQLLNLVLDQTVEYLRGELQRSRTETMLLQCLAAESRPAADKDDLLRITDDTRSLGLTVCSSAMPGRPDAEHASVAYSPDASAGMPRHSCHDGLSDLWHARDRQPFHGGRARMTDAHLSWAISWSGWLCCVMPGM